MDTNDYSIDRLVADLRQLSSESNDERRILSRGRELIRRAALSEMVTLSMGLSRCQVSPRIVKYAAGSGQLRYLP